MLNANNYRSIEPRTSFLFNAIRAISCQAVLLGHACIFFAPGDLGTTLIHKYAVVIFFVLSGFLISWSAFSGKDGFYEYFTKRFIRIYITLIPSIVFVYFFDSIIYKTVGVADRVYEDLTLHNMLQSIVLLNSLTGAFYGSMRTIWSLSCEWWLYMAFALYFLFFSRRKSNAESALCIFVSLIGLVFVLRMVASNLQDGVVALWWVGVFSATALLFTNKRIKIENHVFSLIIVLYAAFIMLSSMLNNIGHAYIAIAFVTGIFLLALSILETNWLPNRLTSRLIELLANYSYTLFLTHFSIIYAIDYVSRTLILGFDKVTLLVASIALANITAYALAYVTEFKYKQITKFALKIVNKQRVLAYSSS